MTADEWGYLLLTNTNNLTNRVLVVNGKRYVKWATCFIDENGDGSRGTKPAELRGFLIFPDKMTYQQAKDVFTITNPTFGNNVDASRNPTTYVNIKNSGAVFIPLAAYRSEGNKTLVQWGNHGNYFASSYRSSGIAHVRFEPARFVHEDYSAPGQGCMSRLVQDLNE